jgi:hypothetical protein
MPFGFNPFWTRVTAAGVLLGAAAAALGRSHHGEMNWLYKKEPAKYVLNMDSATGCLAGAVFGLTDNPSFLDWTWISGPENFSQNLANLKTTTAFWNELFEELGGKRTKNGMPTLDPGQFVPGAPDSVEFKVLAAVLEQGQRWQQHASELFGVNADGTPFDPNEGS